MKNINSIIRIAFITLFLAACIPSSDIDFAPIPIDTDWCEVAEENIKTLECRDRAGDPMWVNKNGERFKTTCTMAQVEGRIFLNPRCVANAESCDIVKQCPAATTSLITNDLEDTL